ncbi:DUF1801 domain-containing protein [Cellulomonas cellasea]|uniref:YdhG-like domain-containing protein n=1 Tax=Cellulomonas cellasea TaxID=43670 RepID=A0A7W4UII8_9CELL|nr:DUF1801 domain-containing protein [Cellulomonas cellasea]MBB2924816.1 hypothetical protein [Cellulomonas cellasea]
MGTASPEVERYLADLEHPHRDGVVRLRAAILASPLPITEHVKWNAPSFCLDGVDRVTFRLHPGAKLQLVLHRGVRIRTDTFVFDDPSGLLTWLSPDRGLVDLRDGATAAAREADVVALVERWVVA